MGSKLLCWIGFVGADGADEGDKVQSNCLALQKNVEKHFKRLSTFSFLIHFADIFL